jgi:hypothetical protein
VDYHREKEEFFPARPLWRSRKENGQFEFQQWVDFVEKVR